MWAEQLQSEGSEARGLAEQWRHPLDLSFPLCCEGHCYVVGSVPAFFVYPQLSRNIVKA